MKIILFFVLFIWNVSLCRAQDKYSNIKSIKDSVLKHRYHEVYRDRHVSKYKDSFFIDYVINNCLSNDSLIQHLSNRKLMNKLSVNICYDDSITIMDSILNNTVMIHIVRQKFKRRKYKIRYSFVKYWNNQKVKSIKTINGRLPYGIEGANMPNNVISSFYITVNQKDISIPDSALSDLFNINMCASVFSIKPIEAYYSANKKYIYVYAFCNQPSCIYLVKFIFSGNQYIGRIIVNDSVFYDYSCFYDDFVGF